MSLESPGALFIRSHEPKLPHPCMATAVGEEGSRDLRCTGTAMSIHRREGDGLGQSRSSTLMIRYKTSSSASFALEPSKVTRLTTDVQVGTILRTVEGTLPRTCTEDLTLPESSSTGTDTSMLNRRHQLAGFYALILERSCTAHLPSSVRWPCSPGRSPLQSMTPSLCRGCCVMVPSISFTWIGR